MLLANVAAAEYALEFQCYIAYTKRLSSHVFRRLCKTSWFTVPWPTNSSRKVIEATKDRIDAPSIHAVAQWCKLTMAQKMQVTMVWSLYAFHLPNSSLSRLIIAIKAHLKQKSSPLSGAALLVNISLKPNAVQMKHLADLVEVPLYATALRWWIHWSAVTEFGLFITLKDLYVEFILASLAMTSLFMIKRVNWTKSRSGLWFRWWS